MQGVVDDFHPHRPVPFEQRGRKACAPVSYRETDPRFSRSIGVFDLGFRIGCAERLQHGIVGNFAGETNVVGGDAPGFAAHERLAPMRRRAGNMRNALGPEADEKRILTLAGAVDEQ